MYPKIGLEQMLASNSSFESMFDKVKGNFRGNKFHAKGESDGGESGLHSRYCIYCDCQEQQCQKCDNTNVKPHKHKSWASVYSKVHNDEHGNPLTTTFTPIFGARKRPVQFYVNNVLVYQSDSISKASTDILGRTQDDEHLKRAFRTKGCLISPEEVTIYGDSIDISKLVKLVLVSTLEYDDSQSEGEDESALNSENRPYKKCKTEHCSSACGVKSHVGFDDEAPSPMTNDPIVARAFLWEKTCDDTFKDKDDSSEPLNKVSRRCGEVTEIEQINDFTDAHFKCASFLSTIHLRENIIGKIKEKKDLAAQICKLPRTDPCYVSHRDATNIFKNMVEMNKSPAQPSSGIRYVLKPSFEEKFKQVKALIVSPPSVDFETFPSLAESGTDDSFQAINSPPHSHMSTVFHPGTALAEGAAATVGPGAALALSLCERTLGAFGTTLGIP
jgi:hypothetical protein